MVATDRNGFVESLHFGAAAVARPDGRLIAAVGDAAYETFVRSSAKPFQVLALLLAPRADELALTEREIALACASHGGLPEHVEVARGLLARAGLGEGHLACGAHPPMDADHARALVVAGTEPTPLHNNCSGKHAAMLLACHLRGWPTMGYTEGGHRIQEEVRRWVGTCCRVGAETVGEGLDGCSVPTFHLSLLAVARGYAALVEPAAAGLAPRVARAVERVFAAMGREPMMVAGPGRFTTRLMEVTAGRIVGKEGAEGFYAMAVQGPRRLGMAFKIADGGDRARDVMALELLQRFDCLTAEELTALDDFRRPVLRNHRLLPVGTIAPLPFPVTAID
ncbi:MAG: asparaginase [Acidobacteriota bacterium]